MYVFDIATVITSKTRLSILDLFLKTNGLELGIRETSRRIKANPMLTRIELMRLEKSGLFNSRKVANSVQYSLNEDCEATALFKKLFGVN
ncbi:MAG: hypothetical protein WC492_03610 [Candidatus Micrarchaeia archaeon]